MKKTLAITLAVLLIFSALSACGADPALPTSTPAATGTPEPTPLATITPEPVTTPTMSVSFADDTQSFEEEDIVIMSTTSIIPEVKISGHDDIALNIENKLAELLTVSEAVTEEYQTAALEHYLSLGEDRESWQNYYCAYTDANICRIDSNVISISYILGDYTGGAHGNYGKFGVCFDAQTGEILTIDTLTDDAQTLREEVSAYIVSAACSNFSGVEGFSEGILDTSQWCLDKVGLTVFASPYEIASYVEGVISFTIPYAKLSGLINEKWIPAQ